MRSKTVMNLTTYALLGTAVAVSLLLPSSLMPRSAAGAGPAELDLLTIVRDFRSSHPDFATVVGFGHHAGNVRLTLDPDHRPRFLGTGFAVDVQWQDAAGNPIAPHLYDPMYIPAAVATSGQVYLDAGSTIDSYDSRLGPYGGANRGSEAVVSTNSTSSNMIRTTGGSEIRGHAACGPGSNVPDVINATVSGTETALSSSVPMPAITMPDDGVVGVNVGNRTHSSGTHTLAANLHCNDLRLTSGATLQISGDRVVRVEGSFIIDSGSILELLPGATLRLYVEGGFSLDSGSEFPSGGGSPHDITVYYTGTSDMQILSGSTGPRARVAAPNATLVLDAVSHFYGTFAGKGVRLTSGSSFHQDIAPHDFVPGPCGTMLADTEGAAGTSGQGGISSAATFTEWFRDVPGTNQSAVHFITLVNNAGVYEFLSSAFYPIDHELLGNEEMLHNKFFTLSIMAELTYEQCNGQYFEFEGDDDCWMFVNDDMVIDLGGLRPGTPQRIDLDRLGLADGATYTWRLFYAHRQGATPAFRLRTNVVLDQSGVYPAVTTMFD
jgi:fibro-slime domain-containing protein